MKYVSGRVITLLLVSSMAFGCDSANEDEDEVESVVGTWPLESVNGLDMPASVQDPEHNDPEQRVVFSTGGLEFGPDSTWTMTFTVDGGLVTFVGSYEISDVTLVVDWTGGAGPNAGFQDYLDGGVSLTASWTVNVIVFEYFIFDERWFSMRFRRNLPSFFSVASPILHLYSPYL